MSQNWKITFSLEIASKERERDIFTYIVKCRQARHCRSYNKKRVWEAIKIFKSKCLTMKILSSNPESIIPSQPKKYSCWLLTINFHCCSTIFHAKLLPAYAEILQRPFLRRLARTLFPPLELIRDKKPCRLFRTSKLG